MRNVFLGDVQPSIADSVVAPPADLCPMNPHQFANSFDRKSDGKLSPRPLQIPGECNELQVAARAFLSPNSLPCGFQRIQTSWLIASGYLGGDLAHLINRERRKASPRVRCKQFAFDFGPACAAPPQGACMPKHTVVAAAKHQNAEGRRARKVGLESRRGAIISYVRAHDIK